jgi:uncharacterized cupredoxin-like copper-binding protein
MRSMEKRLRSLCGPVIVPLVAALVFAACASAAGPGWTYVPPAATPQAGGPAASGLAAASPGTTATSGGTAGGGSSAGSSVAPAASTSAASGAPASGGSANEIDLVETAALQITDPSGKPVTNITVKKGQTYHFKVTNTAGFVHNFYVGAVSDLEAGNIANLTGTGDFTSGTRTFDYTFNDSGTPLGFGCLVPGHYQAGMKGTFTIQ